MKEAETEERFFCPPSCLLGLATTKKIAHLHVKAGYVLTPLAGYPGLAGHPAEYYSIILCKAY